MPDYWLGDDNDVKRLARELIEEELTLHVEEYSDDDGGCFTVSLKFGDKKIGKTVSVTVTQLMSRTEVGMVIT